VVHKLFTTWAAARYSRTWVPLVQAREVRSRNAAERCKVHTIMLAESHLTRRLFAILLRKITALPVPGGIAHCWLLRQLPEEAASERRVRKKSVSNRTNLGPRAVSRKQLRM
jgi:hypothetical protein